MRVGWVGLGAMGAPMAACVVAAGHEVTGYDIASAPMRELVRRGGTAAGSAHDAARAAEALVIIAATPDQVETILFGPAGAAPALAAGVPVLIMSTVGPDAVTDWTRRLAAQGVPVVDAPVSGGTARAAAGTLLAMVSGPPDAIARVRPLLDAMTEQAPVVGDAPGDGQRVKLVNQLLCGVHIAAAAEALAFAEALGLDPARCHEIIRTGAAASFMLDDRGRRMLAAQFDDVRSALDIFVKDMGLVVGAARASRFPVPLAGVAEQLYLTGARAGLGRKDDSALIEVARGRIGPTVQS